MLNNIKILLGLTDNTKDDLLTLLIENAIEEAQDFTHNDNVNDLRGCIIQMVIFKYNQLGTEGLDSEGYSGMSFSYSTDYPDNIIRMLKSKRLLKTR